MAHITMSFFFLIPFLAFILTLFHPVITPTAEMGPAIRDMAGRTVYLASSAGKALVLPVILSGYMTIDEGADNILAASKPALDLARIGFMGQVYPALEHIQPIGQTVAPTDPELIMFLEPDVVFVWAEQAEPLEKVGMPGVVEVSAGGKDQAQSRLTMWKLMGNVAGKQTRAEGLLARYFTKRRALQALIPAQSSDALRAVILYRVGNGLWAIGGKHYNLNDRLELAGAENAARDFRVSGGVSLEQLLVLDPDIILLNSGPGDDPPQDIYDRPGWHALRAVKDRRVYKVPVYSFMNAVVNAPVEDILLVHWMAELFHPDKMPRKLRDEFRQTYQMVYRYAISDDEIDKAIFLKENLCSAGYERFARKDMAQLLQK